MGILQTTLSKVKQKTDDTIRAAKARTGKSFRPRPGKTPDDILTNDQEVERLSQYIEEGSRKKIINKDTGVRFGVDKIGTKGDTNNVLRDLLAGATKKARDYAGKILAKKWARENLTETLTTKTGKEILGKMVSKNIYIKEVSYFRGGKLIQYLQARSLKTGRVVKYSTALRMISRKSKS